MVVSETGGFGLGLGFLKTKKYKIKKDITNKNIIIVITIKIGRFFDRYI